MKRCWSILGGVMMGSAVVASSGCDGRPAVAEVQGRVTLDGAPLSGAVVMFLPSARGRPGMGVTDAEGRYELVFEAGRKGALVGRHEVKISTWYPASQRIDDNGKTVNTPEQRERLPPRYHERTELSADVQLGVTAYDFDLHSK